MRKIIFHLETSQCNSDSYEAAAFEDDVTEKEINDCGWDLALSNAESYGIYPESDREEFDDDINWMSESYSDDIGYTWEDYNPKKHDKLVPGGGKWNWEI